MEKIRLCLPYFGNKETLMQLFEEIINSGSLVQDKYVASLEEHVASYLSIKHAIAVSSGTAALHLSLIALGIGPGDEVIVPAYTFPATANVVQLTGAKPIFVDVDLETYNISVDQIKKSITPKTKAIIPVHLFGNPADMDPIMEVAMKHNIWVIEDAAGALGAEYKGRKCGTIGHIGCFSFHPRKIITTGEGGMVVTNDDELANKIRLLRNHGRQVLENKIDFILPGFNYRMNELEAALALVQIREIEVIINQRQRLANLYKIALANIPNIDLQQTLPNCKSVWQAFVIRLKNREAHSIIKKLQEANIEANIGTFALHILHFYSQTYNYKYSDYQNAFELFSKSIALPFYTSLSQENIYYIITTLQSLINEN